jgi:amidase
MTILSMYEALQKQETTAIDCFKATLKRYEETRSKNPIGCLSPRAESYAQQADDERMRGFYRGLLQGIPIVIKDNILYADGTPTTANSYALSTFFPTTNAPLVDRLIKAGAVIVGKANLSEFAYFMSDETMPSGYGSMYGQVKHPVHDLVDPYGSSTGSAVAVALGIVPAAIGTETNGSLMAPAFQCQIVALKPTFGLVEQQGIIPIAPSQDTAGPMATDVVDCAILMDVLVDETKKPKRHYSYVEQLKTAPRHVRIGIATFTNLSYDALQRESLSKLSFMLEHLGWVHETVNLVNPPLENYETLKREFKVSLNAFLNEHVNEGAAENLETIIAFNEQHAARCLRYGQVTLIDSQTKPNVLDDTYVNLKKHLMTEASLLDSVLTEKGLDAIILPTWFGFAPIFGNPSLCIPLGYVNTQPTGLILIGKKEDDGRLMQIGHALFECFKSLFSPKAQ